MLTAPVVERFLRDQVVKVRVNPETSTSDRELADHFSVDRYPILLVTCGGQTQPISTHTKRRGETLLRTPEEFVAGLEEALARCVDNEFQQARTQLRRGDAEGAIARLDDLLALRPHMAGAWVERGLAHAQAGAPDVALDDLRRAVGVDAEAVAAFDALDSVLSRQERWDETAACWTRLIERQPANAHALLWRSASFYRKGDRDRARGDAREACRLGEAQACEQLARLGP